MLQTERITSEISEYLHSCGRIFSSQPFEVRSGDRVAVVMLVSGAPETEAEVTDFVYRLNMVPFSLSSPAKRWFAHIKARFKARVSKRKALQYYDSIGGGFSINRFNIEQAAELRRTLNNCSRVPAGAKVKTYLASPFAAPAMRDTAKKMVADGTTHVVVLPLLPQFEPQHLGWALSFWLRMVSGIEIVNKPTATVGEFAIRESFVGALNERIDQALQRFPRLVRPHVGILFVANSPAVKPNKGVIDSDNCSIQRTIDLLMSQREDNRASSLALVNKTSWQSGFDPSVKQRLNHFVGNGKRAILVVPVDHVSDQFDTTFLFEVELRKLAETTGVTHYHVSSGLNCHPLFMDGLKNLVAETLNQTKESQEPHSNELGGRSRFVGSKIGVQFR